MKIKVSDGIVTLSRTVPDADQRALAEDTVRNLPGVVQVDNPHQGRVRFGRALGRLDRHQDPHEAPRVEQRQHGGTPRSTSVTARGVVTPTGKADNMAQKELTTAIVKDIEGVRSVNNEIIVTDKADKAVVESHGESRTTGEVFDDASITAQVKYALLTHKSTSAMKTNVTTKDGVVMIEGNASSYAEKDLVTRLAEGVRGVRTVPATRWS